MKKYLIWACSLMVVDQLIKVVVVRNLKDTIVLIPGFFELTYVQNFGISFGKLYGRLLIIGVISVILIGVIIYLMNYYRNNKYYMIGLTAMFAGAIGNFIDRFFRGFVVDYLNFYIFSYDFPVFNLADILLVCGALFLAGVIIKEEMEKKNA